MQPALVSHMALLWRTISLNLEPQRLFLLLVQKRFLISQILMIAPLHLSSPMVRVQL